MRLSSLIKELQDYLEKHGDIPVYCWPNDGQIERKVNE